MSGYSYERRLHWSECDPAGIIFFPNYARWAVDGLNEMLLGSGCSLNRKLAGGEIEGIPCVQFNMLFLGAPELHTTIRHEISVLRFGKTSFTVRHRFCSASGIHAEITDVRVWSVHGETGLRKSPLPPEVIQILTDHLAPSDAE